MNPYVIIGLLLAWLASVAGVGYWQHQDGVTVTEAKYAQRDRDAEHNNSLATFTAEEKVRHAEQSHADLLAAVSENYEKRIHDEKDKSDALAARYRTGTFRLYDRHATLAAVPGSSAVSQVATGPSRCDGAGDGGLSAVTSGDLLDLGGRCNLVRDRLTACQSVVKADRAQ